MNNEQEKNVVISEADPKLKEVKKLYRVISIAPTMPHRGSVYENVQITWLMERYESTVPYHKAILNYQPSKDGHRQYEEGKTEEWIRCPMCHNHGLRLTLPEMKGVCPECGFVSGGVGGVSDPQKTRLTKKEKWEKLEHYANTPLTDFCQFDAFFNVKEDCVMRPDEDGMCVWESRTQELMSGCCEVRVLVLTKKERVKDKANVVLALRKIANSIERHGLEFLTEHSDDIGDDDMPF